jgi:hypothetical protein
MERVPKIPSLLMALVASSFALAFPVSGQTTISPPKASTRDTSATPISAELMQKFITVASINGCYLLLEKVPYDTVLKAGIGAVAGIIYTDHASRILGINEAKPLDDSQLSNGIGLDLSLQIAGRCEKLVPPDVIKSLKSFIESNSTKK